MARKKKQPSTPEVIAEVKSALEVVNKEGYNGEPLVKTEILTGDLKDNVEIKCGYHAEPVEEDVVQMLANANEMLQEELDIAKKALVDQQVHYDLVVRYMQDAIEGLLKQLDNTVMKYKQKNWFGKVMGNSAFVDKVDTLSLLIYQTLNRY